MFTFKEALCLLAIVIAYGITGRMDYEDALLLEQAGHRVDRACSTPSAAVDLPPVVGQRDPPDTARRPEGRRHDVACAPSPL